MTSTRYNSIAAAIALPFALFLWQGSSCRSSKANSNANVAMNTNTSTSTVGDLRGVWGAQGVAMEVTDSGATIEYDCAHGRITEKIAPGADGKFEAKGTHKRERGGPVRLEDENNGQPAVYRGSVKDETMTLTVELAANNESVGTFTLTKGRTGRLRKCL
jgi:hypothetical protein